MKHYPINIIEPLISVHWKVKSKRKYSSDYSLQIKVSFPALLISGYLNLQILSNRFTNLFKPENRTFNKFFFRLYHLYLLHT